MLKIVNGNLLNATEDIIIHQVNCQGAFGAGLAKQIAQKYPKAKTDYVNYCNKKNPDDLLGDCLVTKTEDFLIANFFAQKNYGKYGAFYKKYGRQTNYRAFIQGLKKLIEKYPDKSLAIPYKIGCGLAKGDWNKIQKIFDLALPDKEIKVYKL